MMKKLLGVFIAFSIAATQIPVFASYSTYAVREGGAVLTGTDVREKDANVPASLEGVAVEGIGANAFGNNTVLETISLPESVSYIEWGAFEGCIGLHDINIPDKVTVIEDMTFSGCVNLADVSLPEGLAAVGVKAFADTAIKEIVIPEGTKAIDIKAFENCKELVKVTLPESVSYIGEGAFDGCENLTVICKKGTYAESYLKSKGILYIADV